MARKEMPNDLIAKLEELGENAVRARLARGEYGSKGLERTMVDDWLHMKAQARGEEVMREQIDIARSAADAALDAAKEARIANKIAKAAIAIAIISAIIALAS